MLALPKHTDMDTIMHKYEQRARASKVLVHSLVAFALERHQLIYAKFQSVGIPDEIARKIMHMVV